MSFTATTIIFHGLRTVHVHVILMASVREIERKRQKLRKLLYKLISNCRFTRVFYIGCPSLQPGLSLCMQSHRKRMACVSFSLLHGTLQLFSRQMPVKHQVIDIRLILPGAIHVSGVLCILSYRLSPQIMGIIPYTTMTTRSYGNKPRTLSGFTSGVVFVFWLYSISWVFAD